MLLQTCFWAKTTRITFFVWIRMMLWLKQLPLVEVWSECGAAAGWWSLCWGCGTGGRGCSGRGCTSCLRVFNQGRPPTYLPTYLPRQSLLPSPCRLPFSNTSRARIRSSSNTRKRCLVWLKILETDKLHIRISILAIHIREFWYVLIRTYIIEFKFHAWLVGRAGLWTGEACCWFGSSKLLSRSTLRKHYMKRWIVNQKLTRFRVDRPDGSFCIFGLFIDVHKYNFWTTSKKLLLSEPSWVLAFWRCFAPQPWRLVCISNFHFTFHAEVSWGCRLQMFSQSTQYCYSIQYTYY